MKKVRAYKKKNLWKRAFQNVSIEDVIKPIFKKFIQPFLEAQELTPNELLKLWFDNGNREVYFAIVKKNVKIPGRVRHPDTYQDAIPPAEKRLAKKGDQVVVRFDALVPALVELEFNDLVFTMRVDQWNLISGSIALVA